MNSKQNPRAEKLEQIAQTVLGIETLQTRNRDALDFHDIGVAGLRIALENAYEAGRQAAYIDAENRARIEMSRITGKLENELWDQRELANDLAERLEQSQSENRAARQEVK